MDEDTLLAGLGISLFVMAGLGVGYILNDATTSEQVVFTTQKTGQLQITGMGYENFVDPRIEYLTLEMKLTEKECDEWIYGKFDYPGEEVLEWTWANNEGYCEFTNTEPHLVEFKCKQPSDSILCENITQFRLDKKTYIHMKIKPRGSCKEKIETYHTIYVHHEDRDQWCRGPDNNVKMVCNDGTILTEDCGNMTCHDGECI